MHTIKPTAHGRHMLTLDGCDISGDMQQGVIQCVISLPPSVELSKDTYGEPCAFIPSLFGERGLCLEYLAQLCNSDGLKGSRTYYWHIV